MHLETYGLVCLACDHLGNRKSMTSYLMTMMACNIFQYQNILHGNIIAYHTPQSAGCPTKSSHCAPSGLH